MKTLNGSFMQAGYLDAIKGMENLVPITLTPGFLIYRFGNTLRQERLFTGPWWIGFSPFEALKQYSTSRGVSLPLARSWMCWSKRCCSSRYQLGPALQRRRQSSWLRALEE